jgi:hypothetical protein
LRIPKNRDAQENPHIMKTIIVRNQRAVLLLLALCGFTLWQATPKALGVVPTPDGCYPNFTTAEGCDALNSLTTGSGNTGLGWRSLFSNADASFNTGVGGAALALNNGDSNTAVGAAALLLNTAGTENTAVGTDAMVFNDTGFKNTAVGAFALYSNVDGSENTALGYNVLPNNTTGSNNIAIGFSTMQDNTTGSLNTAIGWLTLINNTEGGNNTAIGRAAMQANETGSSNTAIGYGAGLNLTDDGNVCIGASVGGASSVSNRTWIRNVYSDMATTRVVYIDSDGHLGTLSSSRRYKEEIRPMDKASEALFTLKPVTFRYKKAVDPSQALSFGLIAEEVAKANPALITRDKQGKPQSVRYEQINAMLLNEFLKEHKKGEQQDRKIEALEATVARLESLVREQAAQIQKVSAQLELNEDGSRKVAAED